jgi:hypothetical protein
VMILRATGAKKPGAPGRSRISRNPSRRECRMTGCTCGDCRQLFLLLAGHG